MSYTSDTAPDLDPEYKKYFEEFYKLSDTAPPAGTAETYAEEFTDDATFIMGGNFNKEIIKMRKGMWEKVASRKHKAHKIYTFGPGSDEVMLYGDVEYGMKDGSKAGKEWAARAKMVKEGGKVKMSFYQVYLSG
ncbi:hypothetical protein NA57DRAFT_33894 [Rhizodiscina lignyota]|uniref:SnoaL-like domain-containing protein n=1 Tax=Rhizodiscina lignyota TaxID=1504668 RepID=A0A9P4IP21_9PEZI|nr:hypothetical protein NA57DRAFT_33894 [Rhizodiscina lignyota]